MKKPILYFVLLLSTNFLFAQGNLTFTADPVNNNGIVDFTFDLVGGGAQYDLSVEVSFDNGANWDDIPAAYITGGLNNVVPASGISLQWDAMTSFPGQVTNEAVLRVTARHVCGTDFTFTYPAGGTETVTYGTVSKTYNIDGDDMTLCWLDRNLGAEPMPFVPADDATGYNDQSLYGDLFQWGRLDDGHQVVTWINSTTGDVTPTTSTLSTTDDPMHSMFITPGFPFDWRSDNNDNRWYADPQENNPCPSGWRVPTEDELNAEREDWGSNTMAGAFDSDLKWPIGGRRSFDGTLSNGSVSGHVWSSSVSGSNARNLYFTSGTAYMQNGGRALGMSVRCVREP